MLLRYHELSMENKFISLISAYSGDVQFNKKCWNELRDAYSSTSRSYHSLTHLKSMLAELQEVEEDVSDLDTVLFALFYHDIIYDASKTDNEYQSALFFERKISQTNFTRTEKVKRLIEATKGHTESTDEDTNLFIDIDLSILGQNQENYKVYCAQIRREYKIYSDDIYNEGRKKVLAHFLSSATIYKTEYFKNKYEEKARVNMQMELAELN